MSKPRPPYLIKRTGWKGQTIWYYWKRPGPQIRINGDYGTREFWSNYEQAAGIASQPASIRKPPETLAWLLDRYRESSDWRDKAESSRVLLDGIFHRIVKANPDLPYVAIDRALIVRTRDGYKDTPGTANTFLGAFSGLCKWAVMAGFMENDPTFGVKRVRPPKTDGFRQWTHEDMAAFKARWPIGTRERLAFEILINTGLRRGDASQLGKQHIRNGRLYIKTEKTGSIVSAPLSAQFMEIIDQSPTGDLALVPKWSNGRPMDKHTFGKWFGEAAKAAGIAGNCHGLRKAAASRLAEAGATVPELNAIFGWTGSAMAMHYIERANREKLADNAAAKLDRK